MVMTNRRPAVLMITVVLMVFIMVIAGYDKSDAETRASRKKRDAAQPTINFTPEVQKCAVCHSAYVNSIENVGMLVGKHNDSTEDCFGCHEKTGVVTAHAKVTRPPGKLFRQRKYPNDLCLGCHDGYDDLVKKTKDNKSYTTVGGEVINPHDTHVGRVECFNCHKMHKDKPPIEYCYGCHHTRELRHCKECHAPKKEESVTE
jgi:hypothetical protein